MQQLCPVSSDRLVKWVLQYACSRWLACLTCISLLNFLSTIAVAAQLHPLCLVQGTVTCGYCYIVSCLVRWDFLPAIWDMHV